MAKFEKPAIAYRQGNRNVYSFVMDLEEVKRYLPLRTAEDANQIRDTNRALVPSHTRRIKTYLAETEEWVLPAITLAVSTQSVVFTPAESEEVGTIRVSNDDDNERTLFRIVDGQHRRHAIEDLMADYEQRDPDLWARMGASGLSVTLYEESDPVKIRQMFATMALSKAIDRNTQQQFDSSNPFNNAASYAAENSVILAHGQRVNTHRQNLQRASDEFMTHNDLKDIAIALTLGLPVRAPSQTQIKYHRTAEQQDKLYEGMKVFLDEFLPECSQQLTDLMNGEIPAAHMSVVRMDRWMLEPAFVKLLAGCYQIWTDSDPDTDALSHHIRLRMNFDRSVALGKSDAELLELVDRSGQMPKPIRKTSPVWKDAAVRICHAAREYAG